MWGICGQCILHRLCGHVLNITTNVWAEALKENGNIRSILCGWNIHHRRVHVSEGMHAKLSNTWYHLPTTTSNNDNQRHVCPAIVCPQYPKLHLVLQAAQFRLSRSTIIAARRTASLTWVRVDLATSQTFFIVRERERVWTTGDRWLVLYSALCDSVPKECMHGSTGHQHRRSLFQSTKNNMSLSKCWVLRTTCLWLCSDPVSNQPFP